MKLLFLAPQPFFQERGTPIAVRLALEVLAKRGQDEIDLLTYHEGAKVEIPGVTIHRISPPKFLSSWLCAISPGVSLKKLVCDLFFLFAALKLVARSRYQLVHAVEESVFAALLIRFIWGIPYVYDMDSSIALQLTEKWFLLKPFSPIFYWLERLAVRSSMAVVPVCNALQVIAKKHGARESYVLHDISLINNQAGITPDVLLREEAQIDRSLDSAIVLYTGNLESYQGIDLLLASWALIKKGSNAALQSAHLVLIGGASALVTQYRAIVAKLGLEDSVHLLGPRPLSLLGHYLSQADILVSPRVRGNNTPMKIYSYLHSSRPILATDLPTHTQVMDSSVAMLCSPTPEAFADGLRTLLNDKDLREKLAQGSLKLAEQRYTFPIFEQQLNMIYDRVGEEMERVKAA